MPSPAEVEKSIEDSIRSTIATRKPNLSALSVKAYVSVLKSLHRKVFPREDFDMSNFSKSEKILKALEDTPPKKRKTILSSILAVCDEDKCDDYRRILMDDSMKTALESKKQKKSPREAENWMDLADVKEMVKPHKEYFDDFVKVVKNPTMDQLQRAQNYVLLLLTTGEGGMPPRRSIDWTLMKHREAGEEDNFYDGKAMHFRRYKTAKYHGAQTFPVPVTLRTILKRWISKIPEGIDHLFFDSKGKALSNVQLTQRLNRIFGKKISTSMLRHIFVTDKYKDIPALTEMLDTAEQMGHDLEMHLSYARKK